MITDCSTARAWLSPRERPSPATPETIEARRHLDECAACRGYFAQDDALLSAYLRLRRVKAPRALRERIFQSLARERATRSAAPRDAAIDSGPPRHAAIDSGRHRALAGTRVPALAAVAIALLIGVWAGIASQTRTVAPNPAAEGTAFAEDYIRRAVGEDHMATSDPREISQFLVRELGMSISPLELADLELAGAEICLLEGRRGAIILYKQNGRVVSHYLIPRGGSRPRPPAAMTRPGLAQAGGPAPAVVTWATTGLEHALVGPFPSDHLLDLVHQAVSDS